MSTTHNNIHASYHWLLGTLLNLTHLFLLIALAGGLIIVVPASARSNEVPNTKTGSTLGTVVDSNDDTIPNATVVLQNPVGDALTVVTKDDGSFAFHEVTPGIAYPITIAAAGFAEWSSSVTAEPGQDKTNRHQTPNCGCAPGGYCDLFLEGGCCPTAQGGRAPARSRFYT